MLILGMAGSGKSRLLTTIASRLDRVYVVDPKGLDLLPNSVVVRSDVEAARALRAGARRLTYVPARFEIPGLGEAVDRHLEIILERGIPWAFAFHELGDVADHTRTPPALGELYRKGRALGHTTIAAMQRPVTIPRVAVSESNHVFLFAVMHQGDRDAAAAYMGDAVRVPLPLPFDYTFWYRDPSGGLSRCAPLA